MPPETFRETLPKPLSKPRLRGVSHELACYASALAGSYLVSQTRVADQDRAVLYGVAAYSFCLFALFAASALYHRPNWNPVARERMRKVDHSAIYLLIGGTVTPIGLIALEGGSRLAFLLTLWIGSLIGIVSSLLWIRAPKPVSALAYVLIGLAAVPFMPQISAAVGTVPTQLILVGAGLYLLGAAVYAARRPNPLPEHFGYHEIFHALVVAAAACHYAAILLLVRRLGG